MVKVASLFCGVGGFEKGFLQADPNTEIVFSSEIDKYAKQIYTKNYGVEPYGDITKINEADIPRHDILCGGFPCQDVSLSGKRVGICGARSKLFFEIIRILHEQKPKLVFLENVEGLLSSNRGWDFATVILELEGAGYTCEWQILNSKNYGVPQNRKRVFIVGHLGGFGGREIYPIETYDYQADDIQEQTTNCLTARYERGQSTGTYVVEDKFDAQGVKKVAGCLTGGGNSGGLHSDMTYIPCHSTLPRTSKSGKGGTGPLYRNDGISYCLDAANNIAIDTRPQGDPRFTELSPTLQATGYKEQIKVSKNNTIRRLTPRECERLQGFPDNWTAEGIDSNGNIVEISDTQRYKCLGNAVTVPVIEFLANRILKIL